MFKNNIMDKINIKDIIIKHTKEFYNSTGDGSCAIGYNASQRNCVDYPNAIKEIVNEVVNKCAEQAKIIGLDLGYKPKGSDINFRIVAGEIDKDSILKIKEQIVYE